MLVYVYIYMYRLLVHLVFFVILCFTYILILQKLIYSVHRFLDVLEMPTEWALIIVFQVFKRRCDVMNCSCYITMKILMIGIKMAKRVMEKT